jgi:hypothetical protein
MTEPLSDRDVLTGFWIRLDALTGSEWEVFYRLVRKALLRCPASELTALPDTRESYIDEFFTEKLFFKAQRKSDTGIQSISGGALCRFFRNYLTDQLRHYESRPLTDEEPTDYAGGERDDGEQFVDAFLSKIGREHLEISVQEFLDTLPDWALLMLRGHFCANDGEAAPMSALCKGIPSYHYKAQKLGITVKKDEVAGQIGYEHTIIGQWMQSLGISIAPQNQLLMEFLLGLVCLEAAARVDCKK